MSKFKILLKIKLHEVIKANAALNFILFLNIYTFVKGYLNAAINSLPKFLKL